MFCFVCNLCDKNLLIDKPCDKLVIVLLIALCKYWDKVVALLSFLQGQLAVKYCFGKNLYQSFCFVCNLCDKNLLIDKPCDKLVIVLLIALCKYWDKVVALLSFLQGQLAVDYDILMGTKLTKVQKISMMIGSKHKI